MRRHGRPLARRRRGLVARQLDGGRRSGRGHLRDGRRSVRRLRNAGVHQRQGARELLASFPDHVPQRGTARRSTAAHHADLRPPHRPQRGVGCGLRSRAPALVPGAGQGTGGRRHVLSLQRVRRGGGGIPRGARARRVLGSLELRQVPRERRRCRHVVADPVHQPSAEGWPHAAHRDAEPTGQDRRRVLRQSPRRERVLPVRFASRRDTPLPLVHRPPAIGRFGHVQEPRAVDGGAHRGRTSGARCAAGSDGHVPRQLGFSLHVVPPGAHRHGRGVAVADDVHGRSRLRDLGRSRVPALPFRSDLGSRQAVRHATVRVPRADHDATREELRHMVP